MLARTSLKAMWAPRLPTSASGKEHIGLCFFVQEHGGTRFPTHTGGQQSVRDVLLRAPAASGTGACGAFNTSTAGPVMARLRTLCMEKLSLPMVGK